MKRTLTDEQIAIFRHSEIETLLRERRQAAEAKEDVSESEIEESPAAAIVAREPVQEEQLVQTAVQAIIGPILPPSLEDGELDDDIPKSAPITAAVPAKPAHKTKGQKKREKKEREMRGKGQQREPKPKGFFRQNVKPDLRKRTWDVVEKGMDGLDYDDMEGGGEARPGVAKRRQISYDD